MRPLLEWHASREFWREVRLEPIVRRCGERALQQLEGTIHEDVVSETTRRDKCKIKLPPKHWGYRLCRALREAEADALGPE